MGYLSPFSSFVCNPCNLWTSPTSPVVRNLYLLGNWFAFDGTFLQNWFPFHPLSNLVQYVCWLLRHGKEDISKLNLILTKNDLNRNMQNFASQFRIVLGCILKNKNTKTNTSSFSHIYKDKGKQRQRQTKVLAHWRQRQTQAKTKPFSTYWKAQ